MSPQQQQPHEAYTTHQRGEGEPLRETEARALLSCASKMDDARNEEVERELYIAALRHNQRLWTIFQVAVCEPDNELPHELKVIIFNLSRYVDKTTFRAIQEKNRNVCYSLININRTVAKGLQKKIEVEKTKEDRKAALQAQKEELEKNPINTSV
mgnify:CR=1 FL=1